MPRRARLDAPGTLHHVMVRGIERRRVVNDVADRKKFVERLGDFAAGTKKFNSIRTLSILMIRDKGSLDSRNYHAEPWRYFVTDCMARVRAGANLVQSHSLTCRQRSFTASIDLCTACSGSLPSTDRAWRITSGNFAAWAVARHTTLVSGAKVFEKVSAAATATAACGSSR